MIEVLQTGENAIKTVRIRPPAPGEEAASNAQPLAPRT